jgi:hypothetical protein
LIHAIALFLVFVGDHRLGIAAFRKLGNQRGIAECVAACGTGTRAVGRSAAWRSAGHAERDRRVWWPADRLE